MWNFFKVEKKESALEKTIRECITEVSQTVEKVYPNFTKRIRFTLGEEYCYSERNRKTGEMHININAKEISMIWVSDSESERMRRILNQCSDVKEFVCFVIAHELGHIYDFTHRSWMEREMLDDAESYADRWAMKFYVKELAEV